MGGKKRGNRKKTQEKDVFNNRGSLRPPFGGIQGSYPDYSTGATMTGGQEKSDKDKQPATNNDSKPEGAATVNTSSKVDDAKVVKTTNEIIEKGLESLAQNLEDLKKDFEELKRSKDDFVQKNHAEAIKDIQDNYEAANELIRITEKNWMDSLEIKYNALSGNYSKLQEQFRDFSKRIDNYRNENESYKREVDSYKRENERKDEEIQFLKGRMDSISTFYKGKIKENNDLDTQYLALKSDNDCLNKELQSCKDKLESTLKELIELQQFNIQNNVDPDLRTTMVMKDKTIDDLSTKIKGLEKKLDEKDAAIKERDDQIEDQASTMGDMDDEIRSLKTQMRMIQTKTNIIETFDGQIEELNRAVEELKRSHQKFSSKIFPNLSDIDMTYKGRAVNESNITLEELCRDFLCYMANSKDRLYYTIQTVRTFIAGLASSRIIILEGLSGTGKSSLPDAFKSFACISEDIIPVQSAWTNRFDLLGSYNDFKKQYKETEFLKAAYKAGIDEKNIHCIVLDEMNISRIEYYFADLLSVLERKDSNEWLINLIPDAKGISTDPNEWPNLIKDGNLKIGENVWFIGTANRDDSTNTITDKVYDRSTVIRFNKKGTLESTAESLGLKSSKVIPRPVHSSITLGCEEFYNLCKDAALTPAETKKYEDMIDYLDSEIRKFNIEYGNRIKNQLDKFVPVYVRCGGEVEEAVDAMYSCKVIRKLENAFVENLGEKLDDLRKNIESKYSKMVLTIERIKEIRGAL